MSSDLKPYSHPSAWYGKDLAKSTEWMIRLDEGELSELEAALDRVKTAGLQIPGISKADFPLPRLQPRLEEIKRELADGRGFVLLRGLPVEKLSKMDAAIMYWGLGTHLGPAFAQNAQGDVLGHVRDIGVNWKTNMKARGYQTHMKIPFHNDSTDVVGLMCLRKARKGGESRLVSSTAIYNEFLARRPDLLDVMMQPLYVDRRGEESEGQNPYYVQPCFNFVDGRLFVRYNRTFIESAQRFPDVPRLTPRHIEAMDLMDALCDDPGICLDMGFEPGDIQLVCNYVVLHSRNDFEDWEDPDRRRHLLRLWVNIPGFEKLPAAFADRNADMVAWQRHPRPPVFDNSAGMATLAH